MEPIKNTLLLFSKLPEVGLVKTRLTVLKDGMFAPETAAVLYQAMLLDVADVILAAFDKLEARYPGEVFELVISTAPAKNLEAMGALFAEAGFEDERLRFATDAGASFDEHYNDAFAQCFAAGTDLILSMGADMPALTEGDVIRGFDALHELRDAERGGIVLAPDQEMGVSIIGWTRETDFDHTGVFYNPYGLTVLPAYIEKAQSLGLPARYLPPVPDVDTMADLRHNITLVQALRYCAPFDGTMPPRRTAQMLKDMGCDQVRVSPNNLIDPRSIIDG
ncbi:TIGR04282 family arsenosugar biosynthesis glycosyltransferase [Adlercreutzia shanghongiae]|uniref:DUF2064 domain-containing protein n=1 Tax=Adlercreutzia shanghongiae TaxID=3111773 RepID=A0ABU6IZL8_9ACTN|nr:DUF2064 domain-containing protein [Adlercreutzia sp. R22]MEC4294939.1 DUF2064 domain-containing protein [Adlercreutzia sp. R22]